MDIRLLMALALSSLTPLSFANDLTVASLFGFTQKAKKSVPRPHIPMYVIPMTSSNQPKQNDTLLLKPQSEPFQTVKLRAVKLKTDKIIELNVNFLQNSSQLHKRFHGEIARIAKFMKRHPDSSITLSGHADNVGDNDYNLRLSKSRADIVKHAFSNNSGIKGERISIVAMGERHPIAYNTNAPGRAMNRRVDALIRVEVGN